MPAHNRENNGTQSRDGGRTGWQNDSGFLKGIKNVTAQLPASLVTFLQREFVSGDLTVLSNKRIQKCSFKIVTLTLQLQFNLQLYQIRLCPRANKQDFQIVADPIQ